MRTLLLITMGLAACGGSPAAPARVPRPISPPPPVPTYASELPLADPVPPTVPPPWRCPTSKPGTAGRLIEFAPMAIAATAAGPTVDALPRALPPRATSELASLIRPDDLRQCYRWATYAQIGLGGTVELELDVDEFGAVAATLATPDARWRELAGCVHDILAARPLVPFVAQRSVMRLPLTFNPTSQAAPSLRPRPPAAWGVAGRDRCTLTAPTAAVELAGPSTPIVLDGFDEVLEETRARQARESRRPGGWRRASAPTVRIGEPMVVRQLAATTIKAFLGYQRGAYGACFAAARAAGLADGTTIELEATIERDGEVTGVLTRTSDTPADAARCLEAAVAAVPMPPSDVATRIRLTLEQAAPLAPVPVLPPRAPLDEIVAGAASAATAGHADFAARRYGALLAQLPDDLRACAWRVARLAALREVAPWVGAAELAEVQTLAATAHAADAACLTGAAEQLMSIATMPYALGMELKRPTLLELAVARYTMLAPLASYLPDLARFRLEAEGALDRY